MYHKCGHTIIKKNFQTTLRYACNPLAIGSTLDSIGMLEAVVQRQKPLALLYLQIQFTFKMAK
jgi:hypothetical protein